MNKYSKDADVRKLQQNPGPRDNACKDEGCCDRAILSDDDLDQISAAGDTCVPTVNPEVLLGRHALPSDDRERRP